MKFEMNNRTWEIQELPEEEIVQIEKNIGEYQEGSYIYGTTLYDRQKIYLERNLCDNKKRQTLYHELTHTYIDCYLGNIDNINEETICNISACSNDIIHEIAEEYFEKPRKK